MLPMNNGARKVVAVVVPADKATAPTDGVSESEIQELVRQRLRSSRVPAHVVVVDKLPYNDTGKLLRRVLREQHSYLGDSDC